jgi:hypothetical protein
MISARIASSGPEAVLGRLDVARKKAAATSARPACRGCCAASSIQVAFYQDRYREDRRRSHQRTCAKEANRDRISQVAEGAKNADEPEYGAACPSGDARSLGPRPRDERCTRFDDLHGRRCFCIPLCLLYRRIAVVIGREELQSD